MKRFKIHISTLMVCILVLALVTALLVQTRRYESLLRMAQAKEQAARQRATIAEKFAKVAVDRAAHGAKQEAEAK